MSSPPVEPADPALRLAERFPVLKRLLSRWIESQFEGDVSAARLRLLGALHCSGPRKMCALGDELGVTPRNVTALVDALEAEELVRRVPHATDRRATVVELTDRGAESVAAQFGGFREKVASLFRELPEADQRELLRLVEMLLAALQKRVACGRGS
jgi:DNA-binding MarR family transcriptional regulator